MEKKEVQQALQTLKTNSPQRKFKQSIDLIITLKELNLKKPEEQVDVFVALSHTTGKKRKICALIGPELKEQATNTCDHVILSDEFERIATNKKNVKKLASQYDFFIAQANIMTQVAKHFGRIFGPKGKMPNPKAGCVVPPNANLTQLAQRLQQTAHLKAKTELATKVRVGTEDMKEEEVMDNIQSIYAALLRTLPNEKNNVKQVMLKLTMGKPVVVGKVQEDTTKKTKKKIVQPKETTETAEVQA
ncbi:50S ribosomal protein L1 [Candidatus Woesearchaeota archaeon]|nr:50S ribosomal protein L1 [Candidatus Woesearchaeota archaeon]